MAYVAAKCTTCGSDLQLDNNLESGFCMHCGDKIIFKDAINPIIVDDRHMIRTWMDMGMKASNVGNQEEAYSYFTKVIENDPQNWEAIYFKGVAAAWQTSVGKIRLAELSQGINEALSIIIEGNTLDAEEISNVKDNMALEILKISEAIYDTLSDILIHTDNFYSSDTDYLQNIYFSAIHCMNICISGLDLLDIDSVVVPNDLQKKLLQSYNWHVYLFSSLTLYWSDLSQEFLYFYGMEICIKEKFIAQYDFFTALIRRADPTYNMDLSNPIYRLDPPMVGGDFTNKMALSLKLQQKKDKEIKLAEEERKQIEKRVLQQKYWDENPTEYQVHLAEQEKLRLKKKRRIEETRQHKEQLKQEYDLRQVDFNSYKKNREIDINNLAQERSKLGIFAIKQKKEIDQLIIQIQNDIQDYGMKISLNEAKLKYQNA